MLFTSPLVTSSRVYSFIKGTNKNWNLFTEGKMQVLKNTISAGLTSCWVYVYNQGFFPAFVIENRHALSLEFSLKRNLFAGSCHEHSRSAAFIALTSILLADRTFLQ